MEYIHVCPKCGQITIYKRESVFIKAEQEKRLCQKCRDLASLGLEDFIRECPICGKIIKYKRKGDYISALKNNSCCKHCCENSGKFKKGFNEKDFRIKNNPAIKPSYNLDKLLDVSLESFY